MFGLFGKAKKPTIDREQSLSAIPVLNRATRIEEHEDGGVMVHVSLPAREGFFAWFQPPAAERRIKLDELGGFVVKQIDGKRTVRSIVAAFVRQYRTNRREAELSTADFLKSLARRHVISIVIQ